MRNQFAKTITELAATDQRIVLLSGDIGNRLFNNYKEVAPNRFYNCGVAEANMMSMAAGLALTGMKPVVYTITPFLTTRCLEQIKIDVCYHNLPVVIVGTGSGLSYANLGATHHSCEDIAIMRAMPNMTVVCAADVVEVEYALKAAMDLKTPVYIRIGKKNEPLIHTKKPVFKIGKAIKMKEGKDLCIISTGNMLHPAMEVSTMLSENNYAAQVMSMHTVKPLDEEFLTECFDTFQLVVTLEEHNLVGGFGSAVSEWVVDSSHNGTRLLRIGLPDQFIHKAGEQANARKKHGIDANSIHTKILSVLNLLKI
jgi:transketolase